MERQNLLNFESRLRLPWLGLTKGPDVTHLCFKELTVD